VEKGLTVAVIDDDESLRNALTLFARSIGWNAKVFESAPSFLDSGEEANVACIITDVQMPEMTGIELMKELNARNCSAPVICISAFCTDDIRTEALELGAVAFLCKPVKGADFRSHLQVVAAIASSGNSL